LTLVEQPHENLALWIGQVLMIGRPVPAQQAGHLPERVRSRSEFMDGSTLGDDTP
jgi:hypothetical protein